MNKSSANRPEVGKKMYHINIEEGQLPKYVLLPGDPGRVEDICRYMDDTTIISSHREFRIARGSFEGIDIGVCSTGIGGPSTAIALEELSAIGCDTFIRVGSTGAIPKGIDCGDLIINTASIGLGGTTKEYICPEYPSNADIEVTLAMLTACERMGATYHMGIAASTDSFYVGQGRKALNGYFPSEKSNLMEDLKNANVLNFEMESATLFTLSNLFDLRAGSICAVFANRAADVFERKGEENAILAALKSIEILNEWDNAKRKKGKRYFYPDILL